MNTRIYEFDAKLPSDADRWKIKYTVANYSIQFIKQRFTLDTLSAFGDHTSSRQDFQTKESHGPRGCRQTR